MVASPLADALTGIRVLDLSRLLPGPFLTMILADMGADVVKVEDPKIGDYMRQFPPAKGGIAGRFLAVNRGKRSIALDLKKPEAVEIVRKLVATADVYAYLDGGQTVVVRAGTDRLVVTATTISCGQ